MVLGLALFATVAFAQTNVSSCKADKGLNKSYSLEVVKTPSVDYKASIFTKTPATKSFGTEVGDTLTEGFWNFDDTVGMVFGDRGKITGRAPYVMIMNPDSNYRWVKVDMQPQSLSAYSNYFQFIADSNDLRAHADDYTSSRGWSIDGLIRSILDRMNTTYMMIYPIATTVNPLKRHNAYVQFPAIENPEVGNMYEIRFNQNYRKFYDRTYIDFKVGTEWYAREINIDGIDADINAWADGYKAYVMPTEFGQQEQLEIRFRLYNPPTDGNSGIRSNSYGYLWAFDDVAIVRIPTNGWSHAEQRYLDGGYGTLPFGFNVPLAWYGYIFNEGNAAITNAKATAFHISEGGEVTEIASKNSDSVLLPLATNVNLLTLNERGFYDSIWSPGWFGYAPSWHNYFTEVNEIPDRYGRAGLPTEEPDLNMVTVTVTAGEDMDTLEFDTIGYNVVSEIGGVPGLSVKGYRWAHDNGIIASSSAFTYGYIVDEGETYINEVGSYDQGDYTVTVRFTTPDVIPTDEHGKPWVIKGIEIVPQTSVADTALRGSQIIPLIQKLMYFDSTDGNQYTYVETMSPDSTGISPYEPYEVQVNDANHNINNSGMGYIPYRSGMNNYHAVNIRVPGQPELEPNTALHIGYRMAQDGNFAAAMQQNAYIGGQTADGQRDSVYYFSRTEELKPYARQFQPYYWDVRVVDPIRPTQSLYTGSYHPYWPMIRLIVGEYEEVPVHHVNATCEDTNIASIYNSNGESICGTSAVGYEGGAVTVLVWGAGDSSWLHPGIIDTIVIDGVTISVDDEDAFDGDDYSITEGLESLKNASGEVLLRRPYYYVTFSNIGEDHDISVIGHAYPFDLGIEGEAVNVSLGMSPNPASHNVTLNMTGVTGMVNCSIIDMSGRVVYNRVINAENSHTIDLSNVAAGAYFVRVTNDSFSKVEKLIVR